MILLIIKYHYQKDAQFCTLRIGFILDCMDKFNEKSKTIYYNRIPILSCIQYYAKTIVIFSFMH